MGARGLFFRSLNLVVLRHASVQVNTFPSGHALVAIAGVLAVISVHTGVGLVLAVIAFSIAVATVLGRYHYAVDSILGILLGAGAWWIGFKVL